MPIFRYTCQECGAEFELLLPRFDADAECPKCGSEKLEKAPNLVGAIANGRSRRCARENECAAAGHSCCGGNCACHRHGKNG